MARISEWPGKLLGRLLVTLALLAVAFSHAAATREVIPHFIPGGGGKSGAEDGETTPTLRGVINYGSTVGTSARYQLSSGPEHRDFPTVSWERPYQYVMESDGMTSVTLRLSQPLDHDVTVELELEDVEAVDGEDYVTSTTIATIPAASTTFTFPIEVFPDLETEPLESFRLSIKSVDGAIATASRRSTDVTIADIASGDYMIVVNEDGCSDPAKREYIFTLLLRETDLDEYEFDVIYDPTVHLYPSVTHLLEEGDFGVGDGFKFAPGWDAFTVSGQGLDISEMTGELPIFVVQTFKGDTPNAPYSIFPQAATQDKAKGLGGTQVICCMFCGGGWGDIGERLTNPDPPKDDVIEVGLVGEAPPPPPTCAPNGCKAISVMPVREATLYEGTAYTARLYKPSLCSDYEGHLNQIDISAEGERSQNADYTTTLTSVPASSNMSAHYRLTVTAVDDAYLEDPEEVDFEFSVSGSSHGYAGLPPCGNGSFQSLSMNFTIVDNGNDEPPHLIPMERGGYEGKALGYVGFNLSYPPQKSGTNLEIELTDEGTATKDVDFTYFLLTHTIYFDHNVFGYGTIPFEVIDDDDAETNETVVFEVVSANNISLEESEDLTCRFVIFNDDLIPGGLGDTDEDGMDDGYEIQYGLNPLFDDSALDIDGDGLTNEEEYEDFVLLSVPIDLDVRDSNNDGVRDSVGYLLQVADLVVEGIGWKSLIDNLATDADGDSLERAAEDAKGTATYLPDTDRDASDDDSDEFPTDPSRTAAPSEPGDVTAPEIVLF